MNEEHQKAIDALRALGYAVVIWQPDELGNADIGQLEDLAISRGNDYIESCNQEVA